MSEQAKVYYSDLRCRPGVSLLDKLKKLIRRAGIGEIDFDHKLVAIKMHFGEPGNLAFLRPNYAKAVADVVKELGGHPLPHRLQHPLPRPAEERPGAPGRRL